LSGNLNLTTLRRCGMFLIAW